MSPLDSVQRLWQHAAWADRLVLDALEATGNHSEAWREYAHVLATESVWLSRLEGSPASLTPWPTLERAEVVALRLEVASRYERYLEALTPAGLAAVVAYTNSAGDRFENSVEDILLHVALHGQYHRGKINLLLRQGGSAPGPVDYIAFIRGAPAAVTPVSPPRR